MTLRPRPSRAFALALVCVGALAAGSLGEEPSPTRIDRLIRQLGSAAPARRAEAVRGLVSAGPDAMSALHEARGDRDPEVAARAAALYDQLADVPMLGARISLQAEPARVRWDEPFDLHVTIETDSFGCVVPCSTKLASLLPFGSDARQVGLVLDLADFLEVRGPDGELIDPHIFDATDDPSVLRAAQMRADGLSYARQAAHVRETMIVPALNRGRARYRMLTAGTYRLRITYEPEWDDPLLAEAHAGRTESDWVEVQVTSDAPAPVRAAGSLLEVAITRERQDVVATLVNAYDLPLMINANVNGESLLFANAAWVLLGDGKREEAPVPRTGPFELRRVVRVAPGERIELARMPAAELRADAVAFRYESSLCRSAAPALTQRLPAPDRHWLSMLPALLATGRMQSEPIALTSP